MTEPFCLLGFINKTYVCWVNPRQIGGGRRVHCDLMLFLETLGDTTDFDLDKFQFANQVQLEFYHNTAGKGQNRYNGQDMPGFWDTPFPRFAFSIDKWPDPSKCVWMMSGMPPNRRCSTPKCGFICQRPCDLRKHESKCTGETIIIPKCLTYK